MTDIINQKKYNRFVVLNALYAKTNGNPKLWFDLMPIASANGITNATFIEVYAYLKGEGLIILYGSGYTCFISHNGIKAVEFIYSNPTKSSEYFQSHSEMGL